MDIIKYTDSEIAKNFALLENHLKQAQSGIDELFCEECINKHILILEGLAEEGMNAGSDSKKYQKVYDFVNNIKDKNYKTQGISLSNKARKFRKSLTDYCPECEINPKDLNNPSTFDNDTHNSNHISGDTKLNGENKEMAKINFVELGMYNVGQFAAEGAKYLVETQFPAQEPWVSIGGGVGLQVLSLMKLPDWAKKLLVVSGSNLLAYGVVKLVKGVVPAPIVRAGAARAVVGQGAAVGKFTERPNARVFGGRVTATNVPTQYARAGIEAGAQAFEAPEHADLIRVD